MGDQYGITNPKAYGASGDGVRDDYASIQNALDGGGNVYLPSGTYRTTKTVRVPSGARFHGAGVTSAIRADDVLGPAVLLSDNYGSGRAIIEKVAIGGTATTALEVRAMTGVAVRDVTLLPGAFTDGFSFSQTYGSLFERLYSNGPVISGKCFHFGQAFNSNVCNVLYTSNSGAAHNFYLGSVAEMPSGNTLNGLAAQGGVIGLYVGQSYSNVLNGFYAENVARPVVLGAYPDELARNVVLNAAILGGGAGLAPSRVAAFDIVYADAVQVIGCSFLGSNGVGLAAPVTISGVAGTGAKAIALVAPDGHISAVTVVNGGSGYTSDPTVAFGGSGTGAEAVVTRSGETVGSIAVTNGGTGYGVAAIPPIRYGWSVSGKLRFIGCDFASAPTGDSQWSAAMWPWVVRSSAAPGPFGIDIEGDVAVYDGKGMATARMEKLNTATAEHFISWRGADGQMTGRVYVPPVYP